MRWEIVWAHVQNEQIRWSFHPHSHSTLPCSLFLLSLSPLPWAESNQCLPSSVLITIQCKGCQMLLTHWQQWETYKHPAHWSYCAFLPLHRMVALHFLSAPESKALSTSDAPLIDQALELGPVCKVQGAAREGACGGIISMVCVDPWPQ